MLNDVKIYKSSNFEHVKEAVLKAYESQKLIDKSSGII